MVSRDETWPINADGFMQVEDNIFMEEVRAYPVLYTTSSRAFKDNTTTKPNAWRAIAKKFSATPEMVQTRYNPIRTRVSRYLKDNRPSGSGTDDFVPQPGFKELSWLFKFIKTRATTSTFINSSQNSQSRCSTPASNAPSLPDTDNDVISGEDDVMNSTVMLAGSDDSAANVGEDFQTTTTNTATTTTKVPPTSTTPSKCTAFINLICTWLAATK